MLAPYIYQNELVGFLKWMWSVGLNYLLPVLKKTDVKKRKYDP